METPWFDASVLIYVGVGALVLLLIGLVAFLISLWRDSRRRYEIGHQARLLHPPPGQQTAEPGKGPPDEQQRWLEGPGPT